MYIIHAILVLIFTYCYFLLNLAIPNIFNSPFTYRRDTDINLIGDDISLNNLNF